MKIYAVPKLITIFLLPFIFLYGFYVQFHGDYTPGGGFQAGVIIAAAYIVIALIFGKDDLLKIVSLSSLRVISAGGVLIYFMVGVVSLLMGGNYLDYSVFFYNNPLLGEVVGIFLVECGVGLTVFASMLQFYLLFTEQ